MRKEDYLPLKDEVINLSSTIRDAMEIYAYGVKQYRLPKADNLKEMKAVLNILTFVEYYQGKETSWLNNSLLDRTYDDLKEIYEGISRVDQRIEKLCEPYGARLLEITLDEIGKVRANPKPSKALNRLKKKYFGKRIPLAEVHYLLSMLEKELKEKEALIDRKINIRNPILPIFLPILSRNSARSSTGSTSTATTSVTWEIRTTSTLSVRSTIRRSPDPDTDRPCNSFSIPFSDP